MDKDYELDFTKRQLESAESKLQQLENEHELIEDLLKSRMSGNAIALYLYIRRVDTFILPFSADSESNASILKTDKETAEKALKELDDNGWIYFGAIFEKHTNEIAYKYVTATFPSNKDKEYAKALKNAKKD